MASARRPPVKAVQMAFPDREGPVSSHLGDFRQPAHRLLEIEPAAQHFPFPVQEFSMQTLSRRFFDTTAGDLMSKTVIAISRELSVKGAAHLLAQDHISGAPVVNADGRCVGVFSITDFVSWADRENREVLRGRWDSPGAHSAWQVLDADTTGADRVGQHMTANPVIARPDTPIGDLARMMTDLHIHRIIVVDAEERPIGVVSSTDILAAVAQAAKEDVQK
jgi:CBS-domain-containing membrane protein